VAGLRQRAAPELVGLGQHEQELSLGKTHHFNQRLIER
jgi:hypothetical protein